MSETEKPEQGGALFLCRPMTAREWASLPPRTRFSTMDMTSAMKPRAEAQGGEAVTVCKMLQPVDRSSALRRVACSTELVPAGSTVWQWYAVTCPACIALRKGWKQ